MPVIYTNGPEAALAQPRISDSASEPAQTSSEHLASSVGSGSGLPAGTVPVRGPASGFLAQLEANGLAAQSVPQPGPLPGGWPGWPGGERARSTSVLAHLPGWRGLESWAVPRRLTCPCSLARTRAPRAVWGFSLSCWVLMDINVSLLLTEK